MQAVLAPTAWIQSLTVVASNLGLLPDLMWVEMPRRMNRSVRALTTSVALSFLLTSMSRHARLNSSRMLNVRKTLPSFLRWCTKWRSLYGKNTSGARSTERGEKWYGLWAESKSWENHEISSCLFLNVISTAWMGVVWMVVMGTSNEQ